MAEDNGLGIFDSIDDVIDWKGIEELEKAGIIKPVPGREGLMAEEPLFKQLMPVVLKKYGLPVRDYNIDVRAWEESGRMIDYIRSVCSDSAQMIVPYYARLHATKDSVPEFSLLVLGIVWLRLAGDSQHPFSPFLRGELLELAAEEGEAWARFKSYLSAAHVDTSCFEDSLSAEEAGRTAAEVKSDVLAATQGWNVRGAFGSRWSEWQQLWDRICSDTELRTLLDQKKPSRRENHTRLNMQLVCYVAGKFRNKYFPDFADSSLSGCLLSVWECDTPRHYIGNKYNSQFRNIAATIQSMIEGR